MREHEWPVLAEPSAYARGACLPWNSRLVGLTVHPPLPPPFQLPGVAPPVLASRSIPPNPTTQGLRCARGEKTSLLKQKVPSR